MDKQRPVPLRYHGQNLFGGSSAAERLAVNEMVVGSIPTPRANKKSAFMAGFLLAQIPANCLAGTWGSNSGGLFRQQTECRAGG